MKELKRIQRLLLVLCLGLLIAVGGRCVRSLAADATPTPTPTEKPVKVEAIDYENLWLTVNGEDNTAVYFSDKSKKTWWEAQKQSDGKYIVDISWIKSTTSGEINVKGDKNEEIVTVTIPAKESKYKVKFDKVSGTLVFTGLPSGVDKFLWRKTTSYQWSEVSVEEAKTKGSAFCQELEKFRVSGASIYVRISGINAAVKDGKLDMGRRPGKEIKVSITKYANAPKLKVNGAKLTVNTTTSMEYSLDNGNTWTQAGKAMSLDLLAPGALGGSGQDKVLWFRKKATARSPHSKTFVLEIPAQRPAPTTAEYSSEVKEGKFYLSFPQASKATPYEYTVVKQGIPFNAAKASWKSVVSAKTVSISQRTAQAGSTIYIRKKAVNQTSTTNLELASANAAVLVRY